MNNIFRKIMAFALTAVMFVGIVPFAGMNITANADFGGYDQYIEGNFYYVIPDDSKEAVIIGCVDKSITKAKIPSVAGGYPVTSIKSYDINGAFYGCSNLVEIEIPESIVNIEPGTFEGTAYYNNSNNWENGILYIGDCLVAVKEGYSQYEVKDGTRMMFLYAFENREDLKAVYLPDTLTVIPPRAFVGCTGLTSIVIPNSVTEIGYSAFEGCTGLTSIKVPNSVTKIGYSAFDSCINLNSITIPDKVFIGKWAFDNTGYTNNASNNKNGIYYIDRHLYSADIETVTGECVVEDGTKAIATRALSYTRITGISIPDSVTYIGESAFAFCYRLSDVSIGNGVVQIDDSSFSDCESLKQIEIPNSVEYIGDYAFFNSGLNSVTIGKNVSTIGDSAFWFCNNLNTVYYNGTEDEWGNISVGENNDILLNATIHFLGEEEHKHELTHRTVESTCKVAGMEYDICLECGESFNVVTLPLAEHSWSGWMTRAEATGSAEGEEYRTCTVCGKEETKSVPKLNVIQDEKTGIEIEFDNEYDSDVEIKVEEIFDGSSFELLEKAYGGVKSKVFDISTVKDGVKVQPDGKVKVRIPLPEGFGKMPIWVNYLDSTNGTVEKISAKVVNGYVEFEVEHFSYYAVVEKLGKVNSVSIDNLSMNYKSSATIAPTIKADAGVDYTVSYRSSDNSVVQVDATGKVTATGKGNTTITVTVTDENGNVVTDTCDVSVKYTWWQWIIVIVLFGWIWY